MTPAIKKWVNNPKTIVVGVSSITFKDDDEYDDKNLADHHHDHGGLDPQIWHDPHNVIKMTYLMSESIMNDLLVSDREKMEFISLLAVILKEVLSFSISDFF